MQGNSYSRPDGPGPVRQEHPVPQPPRAENTRYTSSLRESRPELTSIQSGTPVLKPVSLNKPVAEAITRLAVLIRESGADVNVQNLPEIEGDGDQLMQLFKNLIANGIRFCTTQTPKIEIKYFRDEGRRIVQVSDNGVGIDPAHYGTICRILQGRHSREEHPGSGLGLGACQYIMACHGGSIEIESLVGQGSTFTLRF
jgi:light-regulated signal transduction histidine kinase (bacteriophytochrome)